MEAQDAVDYKTKHNNSWSNTEVQELIKELAMAIAGQKTFAEQSVNDTLGFYRKKLEGKYTVNQVIHAIDLFTDNSREVPTPADIIDILNPVAPKITQTEYITAKQNWEREGYKSHCYWKGIMAEFEAQEAEGRNVEPLASKPLGQVIKHAKKAIESTNS